MGPIKLWRFNTAIAARKFPFYTETRLNFKVKFHLSCYILLFHQYNSKRHHKNRAQNYQLFYHVLCKNSPICNWTCLISRSYELKFMANPRKEDECNSYNHGSNLCISQVWWNEMGFPKKDTAIWSNNVEHLPGESQFRLTLPKICGATFRVTQKCWKFFQHFRIWLS